MSTVAVSPIYINQAHRFVSGVGPKSLQKLAKDTGIPLKDLTKFQDDKEALTPEQCVTVWSTVFKSASFLEASEQMSRMGL